MYDVYVIGFGGGDVRGCQAVVRPNTSKPPTPPEQNKNCHKIYRTRFGTTHRQKAIDRPLSAFALDKKKFHCQSKALALSLSLQLPAAATNHISTMGAEQPPPQQHPPAHRPGAFACRQKVCRHSFTRATSSASLDTRNNDADIAT